MKILIRKLKEAENPIHPNNINEGYETIREMSESWFKEPTIGERFNVGTFSTSIVTEIIDPCRFKTLNSVYYWKILEL